MKKRINFLLFLVSFICTTAHAQLQKGTLFLSENLPEVNVGAIELNSGSLGNLNFLDGLTVYSASPSLGYFVSDRLMLEGSLFLAGARNDGDGINLYGAGAGARFYLNPNHPKNNFFVEGQYNFVGISIDGESARQSNYGAGVGSTWFLAPGVSFDTRLLFSGPFSNDNLLSFTEALSLGTGLNFYLNPAMKSGRKTAVPALQKGKWMIGSSSGDINLSFDPNSFSLSLLPSIGYFVTDEETKTMLRDIYDKYQYVADPHGAVAYKALAFYLEGHPEAVGAFFETAHPSKFEDVVNDALGIAVEIPERLAILASREKQATPMRADFADFKKHLLSIV